MAWRVEYDAEGDPVRMWFMGPDEPDGKTVPTTPTGDAEPALHFMPSMREWARKHGIDPRYGFPDNDTCA